MLPFSRWWQAYVKTVVWSVVGFFENQRITWVQHYRQIQFSKMCLWTRYSHQEVCCCDEGAGRCQHIYYRMCLSLVSQILVTFQNTEWQVDNRGLMPGSISFLLLIEAAYSLPCKKQMLKSNAPFWLITPNLMAVE